MAKVIEETVCSKVIDKKVSHPLASAARIVELLSKYGDVKVVEQKILTSMGGRASKMSFLVSRNIDNTLSSLIKVALDCESDRMVLNAVGSIRAEFDQSETFSDFYSKEIYSKISKIAKNDIHRAFSEIEKEMELL